MASSPLLALPQELRDHVYSFLFLPASATTEHPFPLCLPPPTRFLSYRNLCLVNKTLHREAKAFFAKFIAPTTTFYFTTVPSLRHVQSLILANPDHILGQSSFQLRAYSEISFSARSTLQSPAQVEEAMALIRLQPGLEECMDQIPGFKRIPVQNQSFRSRKEKLGQAVVLEQTGGEVCDSPRCRQRARGQWGELRVAEVRYSTGLLGLCCYMWREEARGGASALSNEQCQLLCLEGKIRDVWIPEDVVKVFLKRRSERVM